jgi:misacylated tRNA(Ala) deacylase
MTQDLFRTDAYLTDRSATVTAIAPQGVAHDGRLFCPLGGGQTGDAGVLALGLDA